MSNLTAFPTAKPSFSLAPQSLDEALRFAEMLSKSDLVPKDYQGKPGNCLVAMQWGMEIGLHPLQAMQNIAVINGRPALWGDAQLALCRSHPSFESIEEKESAEGAVVTVKRRGEPPCVREFTIEDAKRAGLAGKQGPWQQNPKRMMKLRARAFALRDTFADVLRGIASAEEVSDTTAERDMGAADVVQHAGDGAPATRTAQVKALLGQQPPVTLQAVSAAFDAAHDAASLAAAVELAKGLQSDEDKAAANRAYKARKLALQQTSKAAAPAAEPPAPPPAADDPSLFGGERDPIPAEQVEAALRIAKTGDKLDEAGDLIGEVADEAQRVRLTALYRELRANFE